MNSPTTDPFCPIYREAHQAATWKNAPSAHAGLLFDKFADAWRFKADRQGDASLELEFDKGVGSRKDGANDWLNGFKRAVGNGDMLDEACRRQRQVAEKLGGLIISLTNIDRFVTGMGREHPLENGFAWHHTLGVPYLSGSSIKGMLRAWLREELGQITKDRRGNDAWKETPELKQQLGTQGQVGQVILFDMLPTKPPHLDVDVMTPHYGPYYQDRDGRTPPGDWHSPVPISFLTVAPGASWQVAIVPAQGIRSLDSSTLIFLKDALLEAIQFNGAGAKTAVGYGRFEHDEAAERNARASDEKRRQNEQDRLAADAAKQAKLQQLAALPPDVADVVRLADAGSWTTGPAAFMQGLPQFLDLNPTPSYAVVDWICTEIILPHWKAAWNNPTGSAANKLKQKQGELLQRLQKLANRSSD